MSQAHPRTNGHAQGPSFDERREAQREQQQEQATWQMAASSGSPIAVDRDDIWERLGSPDISRGPDDELEELLATELSDKFVFGNIQREDWEKMGWLIENEMHRIVLEYPEEGSLITGTDRQIMYPEYDAQGNPAPKPSLSDEKERRIWNSGSVKKMMLANAIGGAARRSLTEISTYNQSGGREDSDPGAFTRLKRRLF